MVLTAPANQVLAAKNSVSDEELQEEKESQSETVTETETETESGAAVETESVTETETESAIETEQATENESATETEQITETETESVTETEQVTETETESVTELEQVAETETESVTETEQVTETEIEMETETEMLAQEAECVSFATLDALQGYYEDHLGLTKKTTNMYNCDDERVVAVVKYSPKTTYKDDVYVDVFNVDGTHATMYDPDDQFWEAGFVCSFDKSTGEVKVKAVGEVVPGKYNVAVYAQGVKVNGTDMMYRASATVQINIMQAIDKISSPNLAFLLNGKKDITYTFKPKAEDVRCMDYNEYSPKTKRFKYELFAPRLNEEQLKNVKLDANGRLTIKKGFRLADSDHKIVFSVNIYSNDFGDRRVCKKVLVELSDEPVKPDKIYLVDSKNNKLPQTLYMDQLMDARIVVEDANGAKLYDCVKVTAPKDWKTKAYKELVFTAIALDGGKQSIKSETYTTNYCITKDFKMDLYDMTGKMLKTGAENTYEYQNLEEPKFKFQFSNGGNNASGVYCGYQLSVKGGYMLSYDAYDSYGWVVANGEVMTITITYSDKQKTIIKVKNTSYPKKAAPSARWIKGKTYVGLAEQENVRYKVGGNYTAVQLTFVSGYDCMYGGTKLIEDGYFSVHGRMNLDHTGTGKYLAVYGDRDENYDFIPKTKPTIFIATVYKLPDYKINTNYTLNIKNNKYVDLTGNKPQNLEVEYTDLRNANIKGQPNRFLDYFKQPVGNRIEITDKLAADIEAGTVSKNDLTGYVRYNYYNGQGTITKDAKITVKIDDKTPKYTGNNLVVLNSSVSADYLYISLNKKNIQLKEIYSDNPYFDLRLLTSVYPSASNWTIVVTAKKNVDPKKYKLDINVISADSAYTDAKANGTKVSVTVDVRDATKVTDKISFADNATTTLEADKTASGSLVGYAQFESKYGMIVPKSITIKNMPGVTCEWSGTNYQIKVEVEKDKYKPGTTIKIPVTFTFNGGMQEETVTLRAQVPKG